MTTAQRQCRRWRLCFAENITRLRHERKMSQREIAERMFIAEITVSSIEHGARAPSLKMMARFAEFYGVPLGDLFAERG